MAEKMYFYLIVLLCFVLDFFSFAFFEQQILFSLLSFFFLYICHSFNASLVRIMVGLLLLSLESFFYCGRFGLQLIYLIPATIIGLQAQQWFYTPPLLAYSLLSISLVLHSYITTDATGILALFEPYTIIKIIANIIVMIFMSLIFYSQGKLGNRLNTAYWFQEESPDSK